MKRDRRLAGLSSEHHQALVLARSLIEREEPWSNADLEALGCRFEAELDPHFAAEEQVLLPALVRAGSAELAEQTLSDHKFLREKMAAARTGDRLAARAFGERLREHVRFEERTLFPACEELLADDVLDEVLRRAPK